MPNIELVGFEENEAKILKQRIFFKLPCFERDGEDSIPDDTIIAIDSKKKPKNREGKNMPYIRIASTHPKDFDIIINLLKKMNLDLDVETLILNSFIEIRRQ